MVYRGCQHVVYRGLSTRGLQGLSTRGLQPYIIYIQTSVFQTSVCVQTKTHTQITQRTLSNSEVRKTQRIVFGFRKK